MTNERAIELLNRISDSQFDGEYGDERREALEMAVRALSGDVDTISRKMAIDEVKRLHDVAWANWKETRISANTMIDALKDLPSAQPERKKGKWIPHESVYGGSKEMVYTCDQCGHNIGFHMENYCPSCGTDMRGESDEKIDRC